MRGRSWMRSIRKSPAQAGAHGTLNNVESCASAVVQPNVF
jgi:hypothetical protein